MEDILNVTNILLVWYFIWFYGVMKKIITFVQEEHKKTRDDIEVIRKYLLDIYKEVRKKDEEDNDEDIDKK